MKLFVPLGNFVINSEVVIRIANLLHFHQDRVGIFARTLLQLIRMCIHLQKHRVYTQHWSLRRFAPPSSSGFAEGFARIRLFSLMADLVLDVRPRPVPRPPRPPARPLPLPLAGFFFGAPETSLDSSPLSPASDCLAAFFNTFWACPISKLFRKHVIALIYIHKSCRCLRQVLIDVVLLGGQPLSSFFSGEREWLGHR